MRGAGAAGAARSAPRPASTRRWTSRAASRLDRRHLDGAINAALIAGNAPGQRLDKLRAFWEQVSTAVPDVFGFADQFLRGDFARGSSIG
jgi:hypothetical protein